MIHLLLLLTLVSATEYDTARSARSDHAVVVITSSNCIRCKQLERDLLSLLAEVGFLYDSQLFIVSLDREPQLARQLMGPAPHMRGLPYVLVFRKEGRFRYCFRHSGYVHREFSAWLRGVRQWRPPK